MSTLKVVGLAKSFGRMRALAGLDLTVPTGTLTAVLGPSGCGKTTLLRCVAGFECADAGEISLGDVRVAGVGVHQPAHRRRVAVVPQEGALFPHLSVAQNVGYGLDRGRSRAGRVAEVLELVGLAGLADRMPHQLSGGQQQRVAVARALAPRPPLVLLDEPFSALDAGLRGELRRDVREALRADRATAVLVTHDQGEALSMADEVAVMRAGRIIQSGPPGVVYAAPADPWVAGFVGEAVLLPASVSERVARTVLGSLPVATLANGQHAATSHAATSHSATSSTAFLRPEQIEVMPFEVDGGVAATVVRRDFHGHDALVSLRLADGTEVSARVLGGGGDVPPGADVRVRVRGEVRVFLS